MKLIHIKITNTILNEDDLKTNKSIRRLLRPFMEKSGKIYTMVD